LKLKREQEVVSERMLKVGVLDVRLQKVRIC